MGKSISELFSRNGELAKLPSNQGSAFDTTARTGSWVESGIDAYKQDLETRAWKILGDTLSRYDQFKKDPTAVMSLFGGNVRSESSIGKTTAKLNDIADKVGFGLFHSSEKGVVPIPAYMSQEDGALVTWAVDTIKNSALNAIGAGGRQRPNYPLIFSTRSSSDVLNYGISKIAGLAGLSIEDEMEKGTIPWEIPKYKIDEVRNKFYTNLVEESGKGSTWDALKSAASAAIKSLTNQDDNGIDSVSMVYGKQPFDEGNSRIKDDYHPKASPYDGKDTLKLEGNLSFESAVQALISEGWLAGYKDFAGFEMGSNHQWKIELYPYPYEKDDVELYSSLKRNSCTPGLPFYHLPAIFGTEQKQYSSIKTPKNASMPLSKLEEKDAIDVSKLGRVIGYGGSPHPIPSPEAGGFQGVIDDVTSAAKSAINAFKSVKNGIEGSKSTESNPYQNSTSIFSFSKHCPVISYDFSLGTIKTESLRLFNGSQMEMFAGMNYNAILNMSILDDVYGSMFKYMMSYINACYDIKTHSLAPYYNCAFQINLIIMRSGGQVNHMFKFIGVPIEYTPRLDGQQDPNESRIDITFGIIGFKPYTKDKKVYGDNKLGGRTDCDNPVEGKETNIGELKWSDIQINIS